MVERFLKQYLQNSGKRKDIFQLRETIGKLNNTPPPQRQR